MSCTIRTRTQPNIRFDHAQEISCIDRRAARPEIEVKGGGIHEAGIAGEVLGEDCVGSLVKNLCRLVRVGDVVPHVGVRRAGVDINADLRHAVHGVVVEFRVGRAIRHDAVTTGAVDDVIVDQMAVALREDRRRGGESACAMMKGAVSYGDPGRRDVAIVNVHAEAVAVIHFDLLEQMICAANVKRVATSHIRSNARVEEAAVVDTTAHEPHMMRVDPELNALVKPVLDFEVLEFDI